MICEIFYKDYSTVSVINLGFYCMQANELQIMAQDRKLLAQKIKDVVIHNTEGSSSITVPWVLLAKSHRSHTRWLKEMPYVQVKIPGV